MYPEKPGPGNVLEFDKKSGNVLEMFFPVKQFT